MKADKLTRTQSTNAITGMSKTTYTAGKPKDNSKTNRTAVFKVNRPRPKPKVFDPANPFTHWLKGTDQLNRESEIEKNEKKAKRDQAKSANSESRRVQHFEYLSKNPGTYTREGFFRKLRNEIGSPFFIR